MDPKIQQILEAAIVEADRYDCISKGALDGFVTKDEFFELEDVVERLAYLREQLEQLVARKTLH